MTVTMMKNQRGPSGPVSITGEVKAMADMTRVTVRPVKHYYDSEHQRHVKPGDKPYEVSRVRATELRMNGMAEHLDADGKDARGLPATPQVRMLQHDDGRPNDEPPPESDSPAPGTGVPPRAEYVPPVPEGSTNPEPPAESDSPPPGTGEVAEAGPAMVVENPDSLIPHTEGFVERRESDQFRDHPHRQHRRAEDEHVVTSASTAVKPVDESGPNAEEVPAKRGYVRRKDR